MANNQKENSLDLVKRNEVLKSQVALEEKARRDWHRKWGFQLDFDKIVLEEAAKQGVSEEEYRRWTEFRKSKSKTIDYVREWQTREEFPKKSSGMVGWRHTPNNNLERLGRLYVSPSHTLPPKEIVTSIILG